jgi:hypothetical protein
MCVCPIQDLPKLFQSMETGTARIHTIVASLRNFSRLDEAAFKWHWPRAFD